METPETRQPNVYVKYVKSSKYVASLHTDHEL